MLGINKLLAFLRRQVGLRDDAASATGSAHAKLADLKTTITNKIDLAAVASGNLKVSADTERGTGATGYTLVKSIRIFHLGRVRVSFDLKAGTAGVAANGRIYVNGVAVGTECVNTTTSYVTYTEDFRLGSGDYIQLYYRPTDGYTVSARNFRVFYDLVMDMSHEVVTN